MQSPTFTIDGIEILVEGTGRETILMVHGWPDSHHLWDGVTAVLKDRFRCVRFDLPGYDLAKPPRPTSHREMTALINRIVMEVSPSAPVTLMLHDWGCVFGYEYAMQNPLHVKRLVGVDIGDHNSGALVRSLSLSAKLGAFAYQYWLAWAWRLGPKFPNLANRMTRWMAQAIGNRNAPDAISWQMNYPYAMNWMKAFGGFADLAQVKPKWPTLYIYGKRKPFMFQSPQWLDAVAATPGGKVVGIESGHWMMLRKPEEFNRAVSDWLDSP